MLGVEPAWAALIARYAPLIYSVARRAGLREADAEDVFQEVCVLLCDHLEALKDHRRLAGWLATTTTRAALRLRQRVRAATFSEVTDPGSEETHLERAPSVTGTPPDAATPEALVLAVEERWQVYQGFQELSPRCQELLRLLYVQSPPASYQDIERQLAIPINSISPTRVRCLKKLKQLLDRQNEE